MNKNIKNLIIVIAIIVIVGVVLGVILLLNKNTKKSELSIETAQDALSFIEEIYKGQEDNLPDLQSRVIDLNQEYDFKRTTGLENNEDIEFVVASEPLMNSQAYSLVIVKVKDGVNANITAKKMSEQINTRKWICVSADNLYATSSGNIAFLVMSSEEWAKPVYENFKKLAQTVEKEYERFEEIPNMDEWPEEL